MVEPPSDDRTTPPSEDVTTPPPKNVTTPPPLLEDVTLPPNDTTTTLLSDDSQETTENNTGKIILLLLQIFVIVCMVTFFFMKFPMQPITDDDDDESHVVFRHKIDITRNVADSHTKSNIEKKVMFYMRYWVYLSIVGTVTMITSFVLYSTSPLDVTNFVLAWIYFVFDVSVVIALYFRNNKIVITRYVSSQNCFSIIKIKPDDQYKNDLRNNSLSLK
jgi:hypothetical protein